MFEYIKATYEVDVDLGMDINFNGDRGIVTEDKGHYIGVTFDKDKPGTISSVHPTDDLLSFTGKYRKIRKMSRSQQNYSDYIRSEVDCSFAEWMRF
tara:strand:- start:170 stop:457 length:288 start_codon:yes stop_codon:yes gene_type:complete